MDAYSRGIGYLSFVHGNYKVDMDNFARDYSDCVAV